MHHSILATSAMVVLASQVTAWPRYNPMIPNGADVNGGTNIGHVDEAGVEGLSAFGAAFEEAGDAWTVELCEADSDGDGQTNGQELGDPCCEFVYETNPIVRWTDGVSHPSDSSSTSDPSLWASIECSSSSGTASNSTESATSVEGTSAEETSTEEATAEAISTMESSSSEESAHHHSGFTSDDGTTTASSISGGSTQSTVATPAPTSASTPAATNSAAHDHATMAGATAIAVAAAVLW